MTTIKELLTEIRTKTQWSDYELADKLDVSQFTIHRYRTTEGLDCKLGLMKKVRALAAKINRLEKKK